jgi:hypothetical protein
MEPGLLAVEEAAGPERGNAGLLIRCLRSFW